MDNFKQKTYEAIEDAIQQKKKRVQIYLSWISKEMASAGADPFLAFLMFSPRSGGSSAGQSIQQIYNEASKYFFDKYNVGLCFGGNNDGSICTIAYPEESNKDN